MKTLIAQNGTIDNSGDIQPDGFPLPGMNVIDPGAAAARPHSTVADSADSSSGLNLGLAKPGGAATQPVHPSSSSTRIALAAGPISNAAAASGLIINASFDTSVTTLQASNPTLFAEFTNAVTAAVNFFESEFSNPITIDIGFGWGEVGGATIDAGASGESSSFLNSFNYAQLLTAVQNTDTTSSVQTTAVATLPATDPTNGGTFQVHTAEEKALGLLPASGSEDGSVGLDSSSMTNFAWTQNNVQAGQEDAIGTLEHEISEVLGRSATSGANGNFSLVDMFRYTAADGGTDDPPGSAAGARDEPFVAGYTSAASSYFSWDGTHITLPFETPADVTSGSDVADWDPTISGDAFADGPTGVVDQVSPTDVQLMNVLGYTKVLCFAAGTHILTMSGPRAVEALSLGDEVSTVLGGSGRIVWIGRRTMDCSRHPTPEAIWPIRVSPNAFGPEMPERDLFLSPDHAVYVDNVLIPVKLLVNGTTIQQVARRSVTYYHVELARHDMVLAEGMPAETWLDTGNRAMFENSGLPPRLHPDFAGDQRKRETRSCAPFVTDPSRVEPVWRVLAERAAALGWISPQAAALADDPDLHVVACSGRIEPLRAGRGRYWFVMPSGGKPARLVSRSARPSDTRPWVGDERNLGVKIRRLTLRNRDGVRIVAMDDPTLTQGWWQAEWHSEVPCRWTSGDALLPSLGAGILEVELAGSMRYRVGGEAAA
jgi:hypothetical protein